MRYLSIYKAAESNVPPTTDEMAAMGQLIEELTSSGVLLATEGCLPSAKGVRVRRSGDNVTVTDGPFTEAKELVAGFALFEVKSKDEVIGLARRFLDLVGDGECEIRQIWVPEDLGAETTPELGEQEERMSAR